MAAERYDAFVSYSHDADVRLAPALHSALERLAKPWFRRRALRVFLDAAGLGVTPGLWSTIAGALDRSQYLVLLASPASAGSAYVDRELRHWLRSRPAETVLPVLTAGEWVWSDGLDDFDSAVSTAVPPALLGAYREEPRYLDLRWAADADRLELADPRFREAVVQLAAPLHGRPPAEVDGADLRAHRTNLRFAAGAVVALVALLVAATIAAIAATSNASAADRQRDIATARQLAAQSAEQLDLDPQLGTLLALAGAGIGATDEGADGVLRAAERNRQVLGYLRAHDAIVENLAFAPDGRTFVSGGLDGTVRFWDTATRAQVGELRGRTGESLVFSPDGRTLYISGEGEIAVWDVATRTRRGAFPSGDGSRSLAVSPDGSLLAQGTYDGPVVIWDTARGVAERRLTGPTGIVGDLAFAPDGGRVAAGTSDGSVTIWDPRSGARTGGWTGFAPGTGAVAFSPDGQLVAHTSATEGEAQIHNAADGTLVTTLQGSGAAVYRLVFTGPRTVISAAADGSVNTWDLTAGVSTAETVGPLSTVTEVAVSPDGRTMVSGASTGTVVVWQPALEFAEQVGQPVGPLLTEAIRPDGTLVAAGGTDGTTVLRELRTGRTTTLAGDSQVNGMAFGPDGAVLAVTHASGSTVLWRIGDGAPREEIILLSDSGAFAPAFSPDGAVVAVGLYDGTVELWDTRSGVRLARLDDDLASGFVAVAFSPDGSTLASGATDGVALWDVASRRHLKTLVGPSRLGVTGLAFSADGALLAQTGRDARVVVWTLDSGTPAVLAGHRQRVTSLAFSPDGATIASGDIGGELLLSDVATMTQRAVLSGVVVSDVGYLPDGGIVSTSYTGRILRWDLEPATLRARLCRVVGRDLTAGEWNTYLPGRPQAPVCTT